MWGLRPGKDVGMSVSEAVTKRRRRSFSPEFKREIVALCQLPDSTVASVCKDYDLGKTAVRQMQSPALLMTNSLDGYRAYAKKSMSRVPPDSVTPPMEVD
jgi:transposase